MRINSGPIEELADLLEGSKATPIIVPSRLAPSAIYDVDYRAAVIALVFEKFAKSIGPLSLRRISAAKLKLLQFITLRPWLITALREWSEGSARGSLELTHSVRIRRGFLSDTAYEDVIDLLVGFGILARQGSHLATGSNAARLTETAEIIREEGLFESERTTVSMLADIKLTNDMLEGW